MTRPGGGDRSEGDRLDVDRADHLSAIASGIHSLAMSAPAVVEIAAVLELPASVSGNPPSRY